MYSHASDTKILDLPTLKLPSKAFKMPPTVMVGSALAAKRIWLIMEVVVVFPCVPAMAIEFS